MMNKSVFAFFVALLLLSASFNSSAQRKSETKAFKKALQTQTIAGYDQFLNKYPQSVYAGELLRKKDSIITVRNTSPYTVSDSDKLFLSSFTNGLTKGHYVTYPLRKDGVDYIYGAVLQDSADGRGPLVWYVVSNASGHFEILQEKEIERYIASEKINGCFFTDTMSVTKVLNDMYFCFSYENTSAGKEREIVANLIKVSDGSHYCAMFSGKLIPSDDGKEKIEGIADMITNDSLTPIEMRYLIALFSKQDRLAPVSDEDAKTDKAIEWWYNENRSVASSLSFGIVPATSSLVAKYIATNGKEHSRNYDAAVLDIRDNTVVCAYRKSAKQYILVWCEPIAADPDHDKYLNNIYFENDNSLVLYYYKGKTTFKVRINLATKTIKR